MEGKTGSEKDGCHRKQVPRATQKKAEAGNFVRRPLAAPVSNFGCILYALGDLIYVPPKRRLKQEILSATTAISRDGCDY